MVVYDAAIIGAGADGLTAATLLARAGLKTILLERDSAAGGRCATLEFHPGFRASPYADEVAPIGKELYWSLDLARRGAFLLPPARAVALWPGENPVEPDAESSSGELVRSISATRRAVLAHMARSEPRPHALSRFLGAGRIPPWPAESLAGRSLQAATGSVIADERLAALAAADALTGRAADPFLPGTALHLLAPGRGMSGMPRGGLATLSSALEDAAREAGAVVSFGLEVSDVRHERGRVHGLVLADGTEIQTAAIVSTLDLKRSFLSLFSWTSLPEALSRRVNGFRMAGSTARLLVALERPPEIGSAHPGGNRARSIFHVTPDMALLTAANAAWRSGMTADQLPLAVRFPSADDPSLSPPGSATATVTIGGIPARPFDGAWSHEKRDRLRDRVLGQLESVLPGFVSRVLAAKLIVPPDIEESLALTDGDLWGGDVAADQMLGLRPWTDGVLAPRTPLRGFYLGGPSTTAGLLSTCAAGASAARALIADLRRGGRSR